MPGDLRGEIVSILGLPEDEVIVAGVTDGPRDKIRARPSTPRRQQRHPVPAVGRLVSCSATGHGRFAPGIDSQ